MVACSVRAISHCTSFLVIPGVALGVALASGCDHGRRDDAVSVAPKHSEPSSTRAAPRVVIATAGGDAVVDVEVVASEGAIRRGLMFRQHLPPGGGMLFLMAVEKDWTFWMRNTLIPLDMIFIRSDMTVAGVVENAEPKTEVLRSVGERSRYVLEVNGGWARAHGVMRGVTVRFENVPRG